MSATDVEIIESFTSCAKIARNCGFELVLDRDDKVFRLNHPTKGTVYKSVRVMSMATYLTGRLDAIQEGVRDSNRS